MEQRHKRAMPMKKQKGEQTKMGFYVAFKRGMFLLALNTGFFMTAIPLEFKI